MGLSPRPGGSVPRSMVSEPGYTVGHSGSAEKCRAAGQCGKHTQKIKAGFYAVQLGRRPWTRCAVWVERTWEGLTRGRRRCQDWAQEPSGQQPLGLRNGCAPGETQLRRRQGLFPELSAPRSSTPLLHCRPTGRLPHPRHPIPPNQRARESCLWAPTSLPHKALSPRDGDSCHGGGGRPQKM